MGYYLLDNKNPHGQHYYTTRHKPLRVIVLHITAGLEDKTPPDASAEQTARYCATTERQVSWHAGADSDSFLYLLPPTYTAWHASDYNSLSWGIEISKRDTTWSDEPRDWVAATLRNAAAATRPVAEKYGIPSRLLTRAQVDAGMDGFTYHAWLDPDRRTDPGKDFPIEEFFALLRGEEEDDMALTDDDKAWIKSTVRGELDCRNRVTGGVSSVAGLTAYVHEDTHEIQQQVLDMQAKLDALKAALDAHTEEPA